MKFYTPCFVLLAASSAFSYTLFGRNAKRDVKMNVNQYAFSELPENCRNDLINFQEYYGCTGLANITRENFRDICVDYESEKCQTVLKDPLSYIPNCKESAVISELFSETSVNFRKAEMNIICTTDESDNLCPVGEVFVNGTKSQNVAKRAIRASCRSKKCNDVMIDSLPVFLEQTKKAESLTITEGKIDDDIDKNVDEWVDYLKSKECTNQYKSVVGANGNSSDATTTFVTLSYVLCFTIATTLISLF